MKLYILEKSYTLQNQNILPSSLYETNTNYQKFTFVKFPTFFLISLIIYLTEIWKLSNIQQKYFR